MADPFELSEDYAKRLNALERDATRMTTDMLKRSLDGLMGELKTAYGKLKAAGDGTTGKAVARETARRLNEVIGVAEDFLPAKDVDAWSKQLAGFMEQSDALGQDLAKELVNQPDVRNEGNREQIVSAAKAATSFLDYEVEAFRKQVVGLTEMGVIRGWGPKRLADEVKRVLAGYTQGGEFHPGLAQRAHMIARTEMSTAYVRAQKAMAKRLGYDYGRWLATEDERTCPFCGSRSGWIYRLDEVVMPAHPLCRCSIVPVPNELVETKDEETLNEDDWGEHRESIVREMSVAKRWTIDRTMAHLDKYRDKPSVFEKRVYPSIEHSARPVRVLKDPDPGIKWR